MRATFAPLWIFPQPVFPAELKMRPGVLSGRLRSKLPMISLAVRSRFQMRNSARAPFVPPLVPGRRDLHRIEFLARGFGWDVFKRAVEVEFPIPSRIARGGDVRPHVGHGGLLRDDGVVHARSGPDAEFTVEEIDIELAGGAEDPVRIADAGGEFHPRLDGERAFEREIGLGPGFVGAIEGENGADQGAEAFDEGIERGILVAEDREEAVERGGVEVRFRQGAGGDGGDDGAGAGFGGGEFVEGGAAFGSGEFGVKGEEALRGVGAAWSGEGGEGGVADRRVGGADRQIREEFGVGRSEGRQRVENG